MTQEGFFFCPDEAIMGHRGNPRGSELAAFPSAQGSPEGAASVGLGVMEEANPTGEEGLMALQALPK